MNYNEKCGNCKLQHKYGCLAGNESKDPNTKVENMRIRNNGFGNTGMISENGLFITYYNDIFYCPKWVKK